MPLTLVLASDREAISTGSATLCAIPGEIFKETK